MNQIQIGEKYSCWGIGLQEPVVGIVEKIYENTFLVNVLDYNEKDIDQLIAFHYKVLVRNGSVVKSVGDFQVVSEIAT